MWKGRRKGKKEAVGSGSDSVRSMATFGIVWSMTASYQYLLDTCYALRLIMTCSCLA